MRLNISWLDWGWRDVLFGLPVNGRNWNGLSVCRGGGGVVRPRLGCVGSWLGSIGGFG